MLVKIIYKPTVSERHELTVGKVLETVAAPKEFEHLDGVWVQGDGGPIRLLPRHPREYEIVQEGGMVCP